MYLNISNIDSNIVQEIDTELGKSTKNHGLYHSAHEAYGVLLEEVEEFWDIVKLKRSKRNQDEIRAELVQVASCAIKGIQSIDNMVDKK